MLENLKLPFCGRFRHNVIAIIIIIILILNHLQPIAMRYLPNVRTKFKIACYSCYVLWKKDHLIGLMIGSDYHHATNTSCMHAWVDVFK